eukprot:CAMPEP_0185588290 /NCGR_PEP_ID=MMETSP0434-20130131/52429_1 /TAXON_ID=626734 ORGANISM="Favella taraikaensis, Strain Fe Narragansett Bay" /NCGR_SAMPLE_ID=MMETSP0434 /ASSEMBLY_ACC=CAM_ASM_000379 /LENGTH=39 /DNA_ID= /DNA_START= /DNA_END= /DNA_ORIENTATION=
MTFEFDFDAFGVLEIVNDNLAGLLRAHSDSVAIRTEADG